MHRAKKKGGGQLPSAAVSHRCTRAAAPRGSRRSCSSRWLRSCNAKSPSPSMWCSGLLRRAAPLLPTSPEQKTSVHAAPAERHEATHRAWSPAGRWRPPLALPGGSGARGPSSGRIPRACAPGSPPGRRRVGTAAKEGNAGEPLLSDAEPALHRRVAVPGPQRPLVGGRHGEAPGVDIGCGVGCAQGCVSSVRQRMVPLCPLRDRSECPHRGGP